MLTRCCCSWQEVKKAILADMTRLGKEAGLKSFEQVSLFRRLGRSSQTPSQSSHCLLLQVKDIHVHQEQFSIENGLLTPTLKAKRNQLQVLFQPQIQQLYANMAAP